jgi:translocation and assembly module TamB
MLKSMAIRLSDSGRGGAVSGARRAHNPTGNSTLVPTRNVPCRFQASKTTKTTICFRARRRIGNCLGVNELRSNMGIGARGRLLFFVVLRGRTSTDNQMSEIISSASGIGTPLGTALRPKQDAMMLQNSPPTAPKLPRFRRLRWRLMLVSVAVVALIAFAPQIIAKTPLRSWLINRAASDVKGSISVGGANLCWWSQPELLDVELRDDKGQLILSSPRVHVGRSLLGLALNHADLGTITVEQPAAELHCSGDEINWERALAKYIDGPAATSPTRTALRVELSGGKLVLHDDDSKRQWTASDVAGSVVVPAERKQPIRLECGGQVADGKLNLNLAFRTGQPSGPGSAPQFRGEFRAENCAAGPLGAILRRFEPGLNLDGRLNGQLTIVWNDENPDAPVLGLTGNVAGDSLALTSGRMGTDRLQLAKLEMPCNVSVQGGKVVAQKTRLTCDLGELSLTGSFDASQDPFAVMRQSGIQFQGDVDLARLANMLPHVLKLQKGTRIDSGRLTLNVRSTADGGDVAWDGSVSAVDLRGQHDGQAIAWENPVSLEFAARQGVSALPRVDKFRFTSEFGRLEASGTQEKLTIGGNLDLGSLARKAGQFIDFNGAQPTGQASGTMTIERDAKGGFTLEGNGQVTDLSVGVGGSTIREPKLQVRLNGSGRISDSAYRVDVAGLHLSAGSEGLDLDLLEPMPHLPASEGGFFKASLRGDLNRWRGWLGQMVEIPAVWQIGGVANASARIRVTAKCVEADTLTAAIKEPRFKGAGLNIEEPQISLEPTSVKWARDAGRIEVTDARLTSPAIAVKLTTLTAEVAKDRPFAISGRGSVQGQVARLQRWLPALTAEPLAGSFDGLFQIQTVLGKTGGQLELNLRSLVVGDPGKPVWTEPLVHAVMKGQVDAAGDQIRLQEATVQSSGLAGTAAGHLDRLSTSCDLSLTGQLEYDLSRWEPQLRNLLGKDANVAGRDRRPFRIEGSLSSNKLPRTTLGSPTAAPSPLASLKGELDLGWQSLQAFGCQVGPSELKLRMFGDGWIRIQPIDTALNQGRLKLEPYIRLEPGPTILAFGKATGIEKARITPAMCSALLGYASPVFGGVREADGEVSLAIEGGQVPLDDPAKADLWGRFTVHHAKVTPGPLLQELAILMKSPPSLNLSKEHVVPFRLVNGRVYHQNLELPLGEFTIRSTGSVGLDGSLALMTEMPIPPKWLGKNQLPKAAQTIKLPIGGTISSPRIDEKALREAMAQNVKDAAGETLRQELEKSLQKWLRPK